MFFRSHRGDAVRVRARGPLRSVMRTSVRSSAKRMVIIATRPLEKRSTPGADVAAVTHADLLSNADLLVDTRS